MAAAAPEVVVRGSAAGFAQAIRAGLHELASDEPLDARWRRYRALAL